MTNERAAFEEWCKTSGEFTDWSKAGDTGEYMKPRVALAWKAWQAARAAHEPKEPPTIDARIHQGNEVIVDVLDLTQFATVRVRGPLNRGEKHE